MSDKRAILISGCSCNSLGVALTRALSQDHNSNYIIAIGRQCSSVCFNSRVIRVDFDLNPLNYATGYKEFVNLLRSVLKSTMRQFEIRGIDFAILTAGVYDGGPFNDVSDASRLEIVGVNVCGKIELLHAVLSANAELDFDRSKSFGLIDIGAVYGLVPSSDRAMYSATKAFGLDFCVALHRGREIKRVVYVAPGPIDTHMLHRNHWVNKEKGSEEFFDEMKSQPPHLYDAVFIHCRDDELKSGNLRGRYDFDEIAGTLSRYKIQRQRLVASATGILTAHQLAEGVTELMRDPTCDGEVCIVTAPKGELRVVRLPFSDVRYEQLPLA